MNHLYEYNNQNQYKFNDFVNACEEGNMDIVRLCLADDSMEHAKLHAAALRRAIDSNKESVIRELLRSEYGDDFLNNYVDYVYKKYNDENTADSIIVDKLICGLTNDQIKMLYTEELNFFIDEDGEQDYYIIKKALVTDNEEAYLALIEILNYTNSDFKINDIGSYHIESLIQANNPLFLKYHGNSIKNDIGIKFNAMLSAINNNNINALNLIMSYPGSEELKVHNDFELMHRAINNKNYDAIEILYCDNAITAIARHYESMTPGLVRVFIKLLEVDSYEELEALLKMSA